MKIRVPSIFLLCNLKKLPDLALLFWSFFPAQSFFDGNSIFGWPCGFEPSFDVLPWQPAIQLTFFGLLCHGSHRVLPCEQRPFVSIFRGVAKSLYIISLLACLAVDNRVTCCLYVLTLLVCVGCSLPAIFDRIKWNSKPPSPPQIKNEAAQKPKRAIFPSLIFLGGRGGTNFPSILSKVVVSWSVFPHAQSVSGHVARSPWIHLALKREILWVSSQ